jgi:acyl carrier protein
MEPKEISSNLLALLTAIAPDIDPAAVDPAIDFSDQFDFDSMDRLHFATAISVNFKLDIPEADYARLSGLRKACEYVANKLGPRQPS